MEIAQEENLRPLNVLQQHCQSWLQYGFCPCKYLGQRTCLKASAVPSQQVRERVSSFVYPSDVSDIESDKDSYPDSEEESDESFLAKMNDGNEPRPCPFLHTYPAGMSWRDRSEHRKKTEYMAKLFDLSPNAFLTEQHFDKSEKEKLVMLMQVSSELANDDLCATKAERKEVNNEKEEGGIGGDSRKGLVRSVSSSSLYEAELSQSHTANSVGRKRCRRSEGLERAPTCEELGGSTTRSTAATSSSSSSNSSNSRSSSSSSNSSRNSSRNSSSRSSSNCSRRDLGIDPLSHHRRPQVVSETDSDA